MSLHARTAVLTCIVTVLCGCSSRGSSPGSASTTNASQPVFPLTVTRTGGIAGFHDALTITSDGSVRVSNKRSHCQLDAALLRTIAVAASRVDWKGLPAPASAAQYPDDLVILVKSAAGSARLEDPALASLQQPISDLLADVTSGRKALCR